MNDASWGWVFGLLAAMVAGLAKTGLPGCGILAVPLMTMVFPAKLSVGALLIMLITADCCAVAFYRQHTQWKKLFELFPCVLGGIALGAFVLWKIADSHLKPLLGGLILLLLCLELIRKRFGFGNIPHQTWFVILMGSLAGFATTIGNVAGPIMNIYLLSRGLKKDAFMGTLSWYFLIFNCIKVPVYAGLGMINIATLKFDFLMAPVVVAAAFMGRALLLVIPQRFFNYIVFSLAALAAVRLLMR